VAAGRVHFGAGRGRRACSTPDDRRDPIVDGWRFVTCRACIATSYREVSLGAWRVYAPAVTAEATLLVLEGLRALIAQGRNAGELRAAARNLLQVHLHVRFAGDPQLGASASAPTARTR
jgi:hypothetical protein